MKFRWWLANKLRHWAEILCGGAGSPQETRKQKTNWKKSSEVSINATLEM